MAGWAPPVGPRLTQLLRKFRLPLDASVNDLRQAYLQEAKRLHPDRRAERDTHRAANEFAELKERFEEAKSLLEQRKGYSGTGGQRYEAGYEAWRSRRTWEWKEESGYESYEQQQRQQQRSTAYGEQRGVPVVGFPAPVVYGCTATFLTLAANFLIYKWMLRRQEEELLQSGGLGDGFVASNAAGASGAGRQALGEAALASTSPPRLRQVIEGAGRPQAGPGDAEAPAKDASAYFGAQVVRTRSRRLPEGKVVPQMRDGVALSPAHVAAQDNQVWWIELCGTMAKCRDGLDEGDRRWDTPLHHCARHGQYEACCALLRAGADPTLQNRWRLWPEDLAAYEGHNDVSLLLRGARLQSRSLATSRAWRMARRHADGLGILSSPPEDVLFDRPQPMESLRHAINFAAGWPVLQRLHVEKSEEASTIEEKSALALASVRKALEGSGFELERAPLPQGEASSLCIDGAAWASLQGPQSSDGAADDLIRQVCGLLVFEAPHAVSRDSPGHWLAVRPTSAPPPRENFDNETAANAATPEALQGQQPRAAASFYRLDAVRGPYHLTEQETMELARRYEVRRLFRLLSAADVKQQQQQELQQQQQQLLQPHQPSSQLPVAADH